ncbi:MAG TPA: flagellin [Gaiellaceae bacterium]|nr:flagellin [Gaiellaceae bacterium]
MSLRIQTNIDAFDAHRNLVNTENQLSASMEKLSSGFRINKAADDAAGLAISEKLESQIGGLEQAQQNAQDAVSLVQTGEGALSEVQSMLQRVRDLAVQFNNGTLDASDKAAITAEVAQLCQEISDIGSQTAFNGIKLLSGGTSITFQVGANDGETISISGIDLFGTGTSAEVQSSLFSFAGTISLSSIDSAIQNVSDVRASFGAIQNRIQDRLTNLSTYEENLQASDSSIKDVDMASEMVNFTKLQILQQAGTAMLAQANSTPQAVLSLLPHG